MFNLKHTALMTLSAAAIVAAPFAVAQTTTLSTVNGQSTIEGELIAYDGETYTLRTSLGDLVLDAADAICEGSGCPTLAAETNNFSVAGSGTVTSNLIPALTQSYFGMISASLERDDATGGKTFFKITGEDSTDMLVTLVHSNSTKGITELMRGDLHAAFTTRPASALEEQAALSLGVAKLRSEERERVIAYDALLMVTHPDNPVRAMMESDIAKVYSGEITDWSAFGRAPGKINVYVREADSNSRDLLQQALLKPSRKRLSDTLVVLESDADIAEAVRGDRDAIGLTSFVHRDGVNALQIEGVCGIRVPANEFTIKTGEYLLSRPVYFYQNTDLSHDGVDGFAQYLSSDDAQSVIREAGFVDRSIVSKPLNEQGLRVSHAIMRDDALQNVSGTKKMLQLMSRSDRLSTTFRFNNGSVDLDPTSYQNLEALAKLIRAPEHDGSDFFFMGFSDSIGRADLNQLLALQRAEIVRQALVSRHPDLAGRIKARSIGYGELSPLACNETRPGRNVNRRVEVWVQDPMTTIAAK